jgi:hypothetical protein
MSYDTTGPVKVNETKSLLLLILLVVLVAGGIAVALRLNKTPAPTPAKTPAPQPVERSAAPATARPRPPAVTSGSRPRGRFRPGGPVVRPPDPPGDFLRWPNDNTADAQGVTALRSGSVYLNISLIARGGRRVIDVWRSYRMPEPKPRTWSTAYFVEHVLNNHSLAQRYDVTPQQLEQLKALDLKIPSLTREQQETIAELFTAAETARREAGAKPKAAKPATAPSSQPDPHKRAAEAQSALMKAAAKLTIPPAELDELVEDAADAREILRPDQLDLIDSGFDRNNSGFDRPGYPRRQK